MYFGKVERSCHDITWQFFPPILSPTLNQKCFSPCQVGRQRFQPPPPPVSRSDPPYIPGLSSPPQGLEDHPGGRRSHGPLHRRPGGGGWPAGLCDGLRQMPAVCCRCLPAAGAGGGGEVWAEGGDQSATPWIPSPNSGSTPPPSTERTSAANGPGKKRGQPFSGYGIRRTWL